jgi:cytochrome c-type biogenesis protein CcmH
MTVFWLLCALLIALAAAFVAWPLLRANRVTDSGPARTALNAEVYLDHLRELDRELADGVLSVEQHAIARSELDRRALGEAVPADGTADAAPASDARRGRWLAPATLALIPIAAIATYLAIGNPEALRPPEQQFEQMVNALARDLADKPDNPDGWLMLGRAYQMLDRMPQAIAAFEKASALKPDSAEVLAAYADSLAMEQGTLAGKPSELIARALKLDPNNQTALALAATAALESRQFNESIVLWQRLAQLVEANSRDRGAIDEAINRVRQAAATAGVKLGAEGAAPAPKAGPAAPGKPASAADAVSAAAAAARISGEVALAPELARQAKPDETVFIFARAIDGPQLPLAVLRVQVKDLPVKFTLDDTMSMAPGARLSSHKTVVVAARVSRSGQAIAQPGDLMGTVGQVSVGATGVKVLIGEVMR